MKTLITTVLIIAIIIVLIWWLVRWTTQTSTTIQSGPVCLSASTCPSGYTPYDKVPITMACSKLTNPTSNNYTISLWYYVTNFVQTGPKALFRRTGSSSNVLNIYMDGSQNNLNVAVTTLGSGSGSGSGTTTTTTTNPTTICSIDNVPIQRWVCVLVSIYGRTLDIYIDGKLTKTCLLPGLALAYNAGECVVGPGSVASDAAAAVTSSTHTADGSNACPGSTQPATSGTAAGTTGTGATGTLVGYKDSIEGYMDQVRFWDSATNPQQAYNIYKDGPSGGSWGTNFFNDYYMQVGFYDKGNKEFSFRI